MADKIWCWEAVQDRHGPDWRFFATIQLNSAADLGSTAPQLAVPAFSYAGIEDTYCLEHRQICPMHTLVDTATFEQMSRQSSGSEPHNIWIYNTIRLHQQSIEIECGYGGRGDSYHQTETAFLLNLFSRPHITLQSWQVLVGGNTYDYRMLREGSDLTALRAYLRDGDGSPR